MSSCHYPEDDFDGVFHLVAENDNTIVGIGSFYPEECVGIDSAASYRLRGMATVSSIRGQGIGRNLLEEGIRQCRLRGAELLWCNARTSAVPFYRKLNFDIKGEEFMIDSIGPHFLMVYRYES
ncbi:hypothetical protein GCM10009123_18760 [Kangiella japonica]|uniref:N-acetyltransferase domain-containing protein n=2 Tax=Kangiella japonica TaxID=647384 RepID=A0ABP3CP81_9GAMM